jgi:hypothetical protein
LLVAVRRYEINATPLRQSANSPSSVRNRRHWVHVTLVSGSESRRLRTALLPDLSQTVKGATRVRVLRWCTAAAWRTTEFGAVTSTGTYFTNAPGAVVDACFSCSGGVHILNENMKSILGYFRDFARAWEIVFRKFDLKIWHGFSFVLCCLEFPLPATFAHDWWAQHYYSV